MGTGSLFVGGFRGKARPLQRNTVFAVASIPMDDEVTGGVRCREEGK